ncbi:MAG: hypothetical protein FJW79_10125 [Actinobacteria bacterium]|nr:hypothetical protein [Actinomycetota bacterium]
MRRIRVLLLVVGVTAALAPAAVADTGPRVAGKHQWTRQFGTSDFDYGSGVAVGTSGVYVTGGTYGAFPGWTNRGNADAFVRAYGHGGQHQWLRQFGTADRDEGRGIAAGAAAVYVTGYVGGALPNQTHQGGYDAFLRKYATQ